MLFMIFIIGCIIGLLVGFCDGSVDILLKEVLVVVEIVGVEVYMVCVDELNFFVGFVVIGIDGG